MEPIRWRRVMVGVGTLFFMDGKHIWSLTPANQTFQGDLKLYVCKANSHILHSVCYVSDIFNRFSLMHLKVNSNQTVFVRQPLLRQERAGSGPRSGCLSTCSPGGPSAPSLTSATLKPIPPWRRRPAALRSTSPSCRRCQWYVPELHTSTPVFQAGCNADFSVFFYRTVPPGMTRFSTRQNS